MSSILITVRQLEGPEAALLLSQDEATRSLLARTLLEVAPAA